MLVFWMVRERSWIQRLRNVFFLGTRGRWRATECGILTHSRSFSRDVIIDESCMLGTKEEGEAEKELSTRDKLEVEVDDWEAPHQSIDTSDSTSDSCIKNYFYYNFLWYIIRKSNISLIFYLFEPCIYYSNTTSLTKEKEKMKSY